MREVRSIVCPTCGEGFVVERKTQTERLGEPRKIDHTLTCEQGHEFEVVVGFASWTLQGWLLRVPEPPVRRSRHPRVHTEQPCVVCGDPIQGGQLYTLGRPSPRHLGCR
jgi:hypothetical protein